MANARKVKIMDAKFINVFKMYGPILNPIAISDNDILNIIKEGHIVYESDANGTTILLNRNNYRDPQRFEKVRKVSNVEQTTTPVYGTTSNTDTKASTFSGYTSKTAPEIPVVNKPQGLSKNQLKKLQREQARAAAAAKAEVTENPTAIEVVDTTGVEEVDTTATTTEETVTE